MNLTLIRGDTHDITFKLITEDGSSYQLQGNDNVYFTIKKTFYQKNYCLQKKFGDGISYNASTEEYEIKLDQPCTCNLECGSYVYDIKVVINSITPKIVKTLLKGQVALDTNATHKENE